MCGGGIHAGCARWEGRSESSLSALMPYILKCFSISMVTQEKTAIRLTLASVIVYWTVRTCNCTLPPSSSYPGSDHVGNRKTSVLLKGIRRSQTRGDHIIPLEIWIYSGASPELDVPGRSPKGGTHTGDLTTSTGSLHTSKVLLCRYFGMSVCMYPHMCWHACRLQTRL